LYDQRGFFEFFSDNLKRKHLLLFAYYRVSLVDPQFIRLIHFYLRVGFVFALNALFYTDDSIMQRQNYTANNPDANDFVFTLTYSITRSIYCSVINAVIMIVIEKMKETPEEYYNFMNDRLKTQNAVIIRKGYFDYLELMKFRYAMFCTSSFLILFFSWYYVICFAGIYSQSALTWVISGLTSLVIDNCITQVLIPTVVAVTRYLAVNHGYVIWFYKLLVKIKL